MRGSLLAVVVLSALLLASGMQERYDSTVDYFADRGAFVSLPTGKTLKVLSFGYHNLAADLLFIWSIQFYSAYHITNRFDFIERVYDTITDITPRYRDPYIVGALIMVHEAEDVPMALRLLDKGSLRDPQEWLYDHDAGYYCYKYLKDYSRAEKYYARAAANPDAPSFIKRMGAHMVYLKDDPKMAFQMWLDIYRNARDILERDGAFNHLYQIKAEIDTGILNEKVAEFRRQRRRPPLALSELVDAGLVRSLPKDFRGNEYVYDPAQGTVTAARIFKWKRR